MALIEVDGSVEFNTIIRSFLLKIDPAPLCKVILNTSVWDEKSVTSWEACIG